MTGLPRLLAVIGSGETSPTMGKLHRRLFDRLGPGPIPATIIDTPFGFQTNAEDVAAKTVGYFAQAVGRTVEVASLRRAKDVGTLAYETAIARLRGSNWIMSGPGSPTYALRNWESTPVPDVLAAKLRRGGCLVFASAAAVTLGRLALPVYEIYKVGEAVHWLPGLDLMSEVGLSATVIPHFNNTEGGRHDTRYCYIGEDRLTDLEEQLPDDVFVLGVDEHTACIFDLDQDTAEVAGNGSLWIRRGGQAQQFKAGSTIAVADLRSAAARLGRDSPGPSLTSGASTGSPGKPTGDGPSLDPAPSPFETETQRLESEFTTALTGGDASGAVEATLALTALIEAWSHDTFQSDEIDQARSVLRTMIVGLGEAAVAGVRDPAEVVAPYVDALLAARDRAREDRRWEEADVLRDHLVGAGVEVRDTPDGVEWDLR